MEAIICFIHDNWLDTLGFRITAPLAGERTAL
jgi:hypothetical protein